MTRKQRPNGFKSRDLSSHTCTPRSYHLSGYLSFKNSLVAMI